MLNLWSAAVRQTLYPDIDDRIKARLRESEAWRYQREHSRQALQHTLRDAQLAGHDIGELIDRITVGSMDGARLVACVLHGRLQRLQLSARGNSVTWMQRTPENAPALAHQLAAELDNRRRELGERALANPEPWLTRHLGPPPGPDASPVLREDYAWRAGMAAAYREARGITDPQQAVSFAPHPGVELEALRKDTFRALEIADEHAEMRAMSRGGLEAQVLEGDRAQATAPRDTSGQLRMTAQAEADAWQQAADAEAEHDQLRAENARSLATALAAQASRLEAANARYEEWSARTASTREIAGKARAELQRRGRQPPSGRATERRGVANWWQGFQADADAVDRAIEREHQAAADDGRPWPPERKPEAKYEGRHAAAPRRDSQQEQPPLGAAGPQTDPEPDTSGPETPAPEATEPGLADDGRAARLDELQARADEVARRIVAQRAELAASSEHAVRIQREARAEPEADRQAETPHDMEMELRDQAALASRTRWAWSAQLSQAGELASGPSHNDLEACPAALEPEVSAGGMEVIALSALESVPSGLYMSDLHGRQSVSARERPLVTGVMAR